jgi:hypothetical protein
MVIGSKSGKIIEQIIKELWRLADCRIFGL